MPVSLQQRRFASYRGAADDPASPENTEAPAITGDAIEGETLTATAGTWTGSPEPSLRAHWLADGREISGATGLTFIPTLAEVGAELSVRVDAVNIAGRASEVSAATDPVEGAEAPENEDPPTISGTAQVGETLTADDGEWSGTPAPVLSRQWEADGEEIEDATSATYEPVSDDEGKVITVSVTATNSAGSASATSVATDPVAPE